MNIDEKTVDKLAALARLEFDQEEKVAITEDLNKMLDFVEVLNEVDTEDVEPLIYMLDEDSPAREDEAKVTLSQEEALRNAPKKDSDFIKVPKVLKR